MESLREQAEKIFNKMERINTPKDEMYYTFIILVKQDGYTETQLNKVFEEQCEKRNIIFEEVN